MSAYLLLCTVGVYDVHVDALVHQLVEELSCSLYRLYKHQHGGQKPLFQEQEGEKESGRARKTEGE